MASYRVFEFPHALPQKKAAGEDVRFIRDGFSFLALVFPTIWLLWQRLWIAFALFVMLMAAFVFIADKISPLLVVLLNALVGLYLGLEGTNLKSLKLKNKGWQEVDVIIANDEEEAEVRFFSKRMNEHAVREENVPTPETGPPLQARTPVLTQKKRSVIGGFPSHPVGTRS